MRAGGSGSGWLRGREMGLREGLFGDGGLRRMKAFFGIVNMRRRIPFGRTELWVRGERRSKLTYAARKFHLH